MILSMLTIRNPRNSLGDYLGTYILGLGGLVPAVLRAASEA